MSLYPPNIYIASTFLEFIGLYKVNVGHISFSILMFYKVKCLYIKESFRFFRVIVVTAFPKGTLCQGTGSLTFDSDYKRSKLCNEQILDNYFYMLTVTVLL